MKVSHKTKILSSFGVFLALIVLHNVLSYWSATQSEYHMARSQLAHKALKTYLQLSNNAFRLFKIYTNEIIVADIAYSEMETTLLDTIHSDLETIKVIIGNEVKLVGDKEDETEELVLLAQIESKIKTIISGFNEIDLLRQSGQLDLSDQKIAQLIKKGIDEEFSHLIAQAIEEEQQEVRQTDTAAALVLHRLELMNITIAGVSIPLAILLLYLLLASFNESISKLTQGAKKFKAGELNYRIPSMAEQEFDLLGKRFNKMAAEIKASREQMIEAKNSLDLTVNERTQALKEANDQLSNTDKARRRFFADISHELRTPLTVIRGEAEISLRGPDKTVDSYKASLERIVDQATHTSELVADILFIARKDAGEARLKLTPVDIAVLVNKLILDFEPLAVKKSLTLICFDKIKNQIVLADKGRLRQVFSILLENAIRYSREHGEIRIRIGGVSSGVHIAIEDDGIGIAEKDLPWIFERFYRGANAVSVSEGSGLGLPVAKAIIDAHAGRIFLHNNTGSGITASVVLPVEQGV